MATSDKIPFIIRRFSTLTNSDVDCEFAYILKSKKELKIRLPKHQLNQYEALYFADWIQKNLTL